MLGSFEYVSLPRLKTMCLEDNLYANDASLELFISSCPVLEDLSIVRTGDDNIMVLRVHSETLTSLTIEYYFGEDDDRSYDDFKDSGVLIDAPRLKYLNFDDAISLSKIISNSGSLAKVDFGDLSMKDSSDEIESFFVSISGVNDMKISFNAFEFIQDIPLPQFCKLSCLEVELYSCSLEELLRILQSFPNLKSIVLSLLLASGWEQIRLLSVPQCLLSSLEFVEIDVTCFGKPIEMKN